MSACALLVIGALLRSFRGGRRGLPARPALWRQFPAHECPGANQKGNADNRRRRKCGEILEHECYLGLHSQSRSAAYSAGITRRPGTTCDVPASATLPARTGAARADRRPAATARRGAPPSLTARGSSSQTQQHARVSQCVRLNPVQVEELGHAVQVWRDPGA